MQFLYYLASMRTPFLEKAAQLVTFIGEDTAAVLISVVLLWCIDRKWGWRLIMTCFTGTALSNGLKVLFRVPRPWVTDPGFEIVASAQEGASGYAFPSGHTQSAMHLFGSLAVYLKSAGGVIICLIGVTAVAFSRMFLGVHTPIDVLIGAVCGLVTVLAAAVLTRLSEKNERARFFVWLGELLFIVLSLLFVLFLPKVEKNIPVFDNDCTESAFMLFGCALGIFFARFLTEKKNPYDPKAVWWVQLVKVAGGLAILMVLKLGLSLLFHALFGDALFSDGICYGILVFFAGYLWPMTFPALKRLGERKRRTE